ncbi:MAG: hypothetical protein HY914_03110 [Desulfomonile tiedjei]|nr:hypothetical protein [Desulfomonile tiedjei]
MALFLSALVVCFAMAAADAARAQSYDIRGQWVGNAKGPIFGAEGTVVITQQAGEEIQGVVEGGNIFGRAKFNFAGRIRGNIISGSYDRMTFQGALYADGSIRGLFRAIDGEDYQVFLRRQYSYWGAPNGGNW